MNTQAQYNLFRRTPTVSVLDNRGLTVREIQYHRHPDTPETTHERITRHRYDSRGFLVQSADPRLHDAGLANFTCLTDLAGTVLRTESVDAGTSVSLSDVAGRPHLAVTGEGVVCTWQYEATTLPGRPLYMTEQAAPDAPVRIAERFVYAGNTQAEKDRNLAGLCVRHYETAGLMQTDSIALTGGPLSVTRQLLKDADNPDSAVDWQGEDPSVWNDRLATELYTTLTAADATGAVLTTTDAAGHVQRVAYDVAGALTGSWLTVKGTQKEQAVVTSLTYSAAGQKLREEHGNGVVTTYSYEPQTQRLTGIKTERPAGHASGAKVLQDLQYHYDLVGNVLRVTDDAEETRFWRNQKVVPENTYVYDSLYQLVSATGREMAGIAAQGNTPPPVTAPLPADSNAFTAWTRAYRYDTGGNLTQIQHSAPATGNRYTTEITVSGRSNRAVLNTLAGTPDKVDGLFLAGGHQTQLIPGQHLTWTLRGELSGVTPVTRDGQPPDRETYRYDAGQQRILKTSAQKTGGSTRTQRTLYLPGLEIRTTKHGDSESEVLETVILGDVRVLHRASGKSDGGKAGGQIRYSYGNLTGSCGLEVDGEGKVITREEYYPYGGTAVWTSRSRAEADDKTVRYSGKERDATGLYYYGYRYYQPWAGRWLSADPAGTVDGMNLYRMVRNNPVALRDGNGLNVTFRLDKEIREASGAIPKTLQHIWVGTKEMPLLGFENIKMFAELNPDYTSHIYVDSSIKNSQKSISEIQAGFAYSSTIVEDIVKQPFFDSFKQDPVYRSYLSAFKDNSTIPVPLSADVLRTFILYEKGGNYQDIDNSPSKPFGTMNAEFGIVTTGFLTKNPPVTINNNAIAVIPNHPSLDRLLGSIPANFNNYLKENSSDKTALFNVAGPEAFATALIADYPFLSPMHEDLPHIFNSSYIKQPSDHPHTQDEINLAVKRARDGMQFMNHFIKEGTMGSWR